jgi:hypothetical protein
VHSTRRSVRSRLAVVLAVALVAPVAAAAAAAQAPEPAAPPSVAVGGITFRCPTNFGCEPVKPDDTTVFLRHRAFDLGLFVVAPARAASDEVMNALAGRMAAQLFPQQAGAYQWKLVEKRDKISKSEVDGAQLQGLLGDFRVSVVYRRLRVRDTDLLVGYVFRFGKGPKEARLFERNLGGDSLPGGDATAEVIASITGERLKDLNPYADTPLPVVPR